MQMEKEAKSSSDVAMRETSGKQNYTCYSDQDKVRLFNLLFEKCLSVATAAKQLGIHVHLAQKWAKQYEKDPESIFEKRRKTGRPHISMRNTRALFSSALMRIPSVVLDELMKNEEKIQECLDWIHKWEKTEMDFMRNYIFLDESAFHLNLKRSMARSKKGIPAVVTVPKTRATTTTILGVISAEGLIQCSLRLPQPPSNKKKKREGGVGHMSKGTVTGH
ncbi:hypothetical protein G6F60_011114 [Rhizopus arrhizus]|nr:hypothetical protein G6F61_010861 [Rhizopus arrhizus]KAG1394060.1 hypothetical protein G6F60_011114 [Rhizopus arrhizus]